MLAGRTGGVLDGTCIILSHDLILILSCFRIAVRYGKIAEVAKVGKIVKVGVV